MKITQKEIAERLGVSQSLVSRALAGKGGAIGAAEDTVQRIRNLAEELGYVHNAAARTLRGGPSHTLGLAVLDFEDPYFGRLLANIHQLASQVGYSLVVTGSARRGLPHTGLNQLVRHEIDGLLVIGSQPDDDWVKPFVDMQTPVVQIGHGKPAKGMRRVAAHEEIGIGALLDHLRDLGHACVGLLAASTWSHRRRLKAFRAMAKTRGMTITPAWVQVSEGLHAEAGADAMRALLEKCGTRRPTAIMAIDDELAQGALRALADAGIGVPADMSLTGFDDIPAAALMVPSLTTVCQPVDLLTQKAFDLVVNPDAFEQADVKTILLEPRTCIRESTGPAPR